MGNDTPDTPASSASETPWELAQRLADQGLPWTAVNERLLQAGLPAEDVATLMRALRLRTVTGPGEERAPNGGTEGTALLVELAKAGLGAGKILAGQGDLDAGKQVLGGMLQVTARFMEVGLDDGHAAPKVTASEAARVEVAPFEAADGAPRCRVHPQVVSVGTCPRCGALACYQCAPKKGFGGTELCAACEQLPAVHEARVRKAARGVAVTLFAEAVLLLALMFVSPLLEGPIPYEAVLGLLFAVLGLMQWWVRHPWPGVVGALVSGGLLPATIAANPEEVPVEILLLLLVPLAALLFTLDRLATWRKALR